MTYSQATLEAIAEMAPGLIEYNRGVLAAIGKADLGVTWRLVHQESKAAGEALTNCLERKHAGGDQLAKLLDPGAEFEAETARLDSANARYALVWKEIQALIDDARNALFR